jgi:transcriptional regulator of heat shock response
VLIGSQSPFGDHVSSILLCYRFPDDRRGLLGLVGPLRMNYARNLALMNRVYALLEQTYE